jgi:hypothetical protein
MPSESRQRAAGLFIRGHMSRGETPEQKAQRERWEARQRADAERERERREGEQRKRAANEESRRREAQLAPGRERYRVLAGETRRLAAFVESITFDTNPEVLARNLYKLDAYRLVLALAPVEVKPTALAVEVSSPLEGLRARRAVLTTRIEELSESLSHCEAAQRETRSPPVDSQTGRALHQWRANETERSDRLERRAVELRSELAETQRKLSKLGDDSEGRMNSDD